MALAFNKVASTPSVARSRVNVVCQAHKGASLAATAAALVLLAQPAQAGEVFVQPQLKKVFYDDTVVEKPAPRPFKSQVTSSAAPEVKASEKKAEEPMSEGVDPRTLALPLAVAGLAGAAFAASKIDAGFSDWVNESGVLVRNSGNFAGFEEEIKSKYPRDGKPAAIPKKGLFSKPATKAGTASTKPASKSGPKNGTASTKPGSKKIGLFGN